MRVRIVPAGWAGARGTLGIAGHDNVRYRSPIRLRRLSPAAPLPDDNAAAPDWSGKPWNAVSVRNAMVRLGFKTTGGAS
jgi:hypothetical protein